MDGAQAQSPGSSGVANVHAEAFDWIVHAERQLLANTETNPFGITQEQLDAYYNEYVQEIPQPQLQPLAQPQQQQQQQQQPLPQPQQQQQLQRRRKKRRKWPVTRDELLNCCRLKIADAMRVLDASRSHLNQRWRTFFKRTKWPGPPSPSTQLGQPTSVSMPPLHRPPPSFPQLVGINRTIVVQAFHQLNEIQFEFTRPVSLRYVRNMFNDYFKLGSETCSFKEQVDGVPFVIDNEEEWSTCVAAYDRSCVLDYDQSRNIKIQLLVEPF